MTEARACYAISTMSDPVPSLSLSGWALILGASSGFGEAAALTLSRLGMDICGVHLDRRSTMPNVERIVAAVRGHGRQALFLNVNAADEGKRQEVIDQLAAATASAGAPRVRLLMHSLAFGTLRPFIGALAEPGEAGAPGAKPDEAVIGKPHMDMTSDVMGHSLVYWTQGLYRAGLLGAGSRILSMTSAGGHRVMPAYGAVSAAKAALEAHTRQLAYELAPLGITANSLCAGVTDTPALRKIPGSETLISEGLKRNPARRLTTPQDVADAIALLAHPLSGWITGNVIHVDGGEDIAG